MGKQSRETRRRDICRQYRESGMTQKAFCEKHGIGRSTLGLWLRKERNVGNSTDLKPVRVGSVPVDGVEKKLRIRVKDRIILELDLPASERDIQTVIRAVEGL